MGCIQKIHLSVERPPNSFLVDMLPRMQKGKVLDVGMGEGSNSVYLRPKRVFRSRALTFPKSPSITLRN